VLLTAQIASAYYCPSTGRWLNRDPKEEDGWNNIDLNNSFTSDFADQQSNLNTYESMSNDPIDSIDKLGLVCIKVTTDLVDWRWIKGNFFKKAIIATFIGHEFPIVNKFGSCDCQCNWKNLRVDYLSGILLADPPLPLQNILIAVDLKITTDICN
jgi:hypothetical protein